MSRKLPNWLTVMPDGAFAVDPDVAYPEILRLLKVKDGDVDRYWIEVAYQCAKLAVQELITDSELDPRGRGGGFTILIQGGADRKERWALKNHKPGRGELEATAVRSRHEPSEAKRHFWRIARELCYGD